MLSGRESLSREPSDGVREESLLQHRVEVRRAVEEDFCLAQPRGEGAGAHIAIMVALVADDNFNVFSVDEQAIRLPALDLVETAQRGVGRQAFEESVLPAEVPVAHPRRAEISNRAVVVEGPGSGELLGNAFGERIGLRDSKERRAGLNCLKNSVLQMAEFGWRGDLAGLGSVAGLHDGHGFAGGLADVLIGGGVRGEAAGDDEVVFLTGFEVCDCARPLFICGDNAQQLIMEWLGYS